MPHATDGREANAGGGAPPTVHLYDNTMRDGEQTVGVVFSVEDKLRIAEGLARAGIRRFEAGFAAVSEEERLAIRAVVDAGFDAQVFSLARLREAEVDAAAETGVRHVVVFAPASDVLMRAKSVGTVEQVAESIQRVIGHAKERGLFVRFGCEDSTRAPLDRLLRFCALAAGAGADAVGLADTAGVAMPEEVAAVVAAVRDEVALPVSIHCHNDLGLAVANSLAAVRAGAEEVQVTVNGLGERAGNAAMDEFVMALKVGYGVDAGVDMVEMARLSELLVELTGLRPAFNKPVLGRNAFRHESGIHVQALLEEDAPTYGAFPPEWVGRRHEVAFGKHSGWSNVRYLCRECGLSLAPDAEAEVVRRIKALSQEQRREVDRGEVLEMIRALAEGADAAPV